MKKRNETGRKKMNRRRETLETRGKQMERNRWMKRNRSTLSSLREEKLRNESERHGTENTPPSFPSSREQRQEKRVKHHGGGLQSEASGLPALSRIISVINSLSFHWFVSIFTLGSPSETRRT